MQKILTTEEERQSLLKQRRRLVPLKSEAQGWLNILTAKLEEIDKRLDSWK